MIDPARLQQIAEEKIAGSDLFVVEVKVSPANEIEVVVDSDSQVGIDRCVELSRAIEGELNRDEEDFELSVLSAGIGRPLKLLRQYRKLIGADVEVVLFDGVKLIAKLVEANENGFTVEYEEKVAVEGKKRKETRLSRRELSFDEVKSTCEHLNFK